MKFKDYFPTAEEDDVFKMNGYYYKVSKIFRNKLFAWEHSPNTIEEVEINADDNDEIKKSCKNLPDIIY